MVIELGEQPTPRSSPRSRRGAASTRSTRKIRSGGTGPLAARERGRRGQVPDELREPEDADEGASTDGASEPEQEAPA